MAHRFPETHPPSNAPCSRQGSCLHLTKFYRLREKTQSAVSEEPDRWACSPRPRWQHRRVASPFRPALWHQAFDRRCNSVTRVFQQALLTSLGQHGAGVLHATHFPQTTIHLSTQSHSVASVQGTIFLVCLHRPTVTERALVFAAPLRDRKRNVAAGRCHPSVIVLSRRFGARRWAPASTFGGCQLCRALRNERCDVCSIFSHVHFVLQSSAVQVCAGFGRRPWILTSLQ